MVPVRDELWREVQDLPKVSNFQTKGATMLMFDKLLQAAYACKEADVDIVALNRAQSFSLIAPLIDDSCRLERTWDYRPLLITTDDYGRQDGDGVICLLTAWTTDDLVHADHEERQRMIRTRLAVSALSDSIHLPGDLVVIVFTALSE